MYTLPAASAWILSRRWLSGPGETVREWLSQWRQARLSSVVTGHAVGENAAKLKRARKQVSDGKT